MTLQEIAKKATPVFRRHGVTKAAVFGSQARGDAGPTSDIDFLIEPRAGISLLDLAGLQLDLEAVFPGLNIDLVTYGGIYHRLRDRILSEQKVIYNPKATGGHVDQAQRSHNRSSLHS